MEKSVKDNPEYKMKRQGIIIGLVCLAVMAFLTIFLMSRYRQRTEKIFTELMEESLLFHPFGSTDRNGEFPGWFSWSR